MFLKTYAVDVAEVSKACCGSVAELRTTILKARLLAGDHAEQERAAGAP